MCVSVCVRACVRARACVPRCMRARTESLLSITSSSFFFFFFCKRLGPAQVGCSKQHIIIIIKWYPPVGWPMTDYMSRCRTKQNREEQSSQSLHPFTGITMHWVKKTSELQSKVSVCLSLDSTFCSWAVAKGLFHRVKTPAIRLGSPAPQHDPRISGTVSSPNFCGNCLYE